MMHGQALKNLAKAVERASKELSTSVIVDAITKAESALDAAVNLKVWREKITAHQPVMRLDAKILFGYFLDQYPKMFGEIKKETYWLKIAKQLADVLSLEFSGIDNFMNPHKGILLYGGAGVGKTSMMKCYAYILKTLDQDVHPSFLTVSSKQISTEVKNNGSLFLIKYASIVNEGLLKNAGWFYDDVGIEDNVTDYGNKSNVLEDLLQLVYNTKSMWGRIHMSTNLTENDMKNRYGERVISRINEMFTVIRFPANAKDMRLQ